MIYHYFLFFKKKTDKQINLGMVLVLLGIINLG
jgi:hypothetical protein